ncbi:4-(cytidine 5'-diphospho)-2-C-methyl-D-erythritol kinase [Wenxinia saemankumensis]|uniref:4-diphosphocytidyl-2-C-methyl-D-erythritol kinase n=1 Tax=Wenxinia saemankumensis TaxID=1447782 RepID=A0A1M6E9S4_9RHOB|nr:4-(cytidine 5'-diphospho)-2-C-methyl-D-erythritol kinase [Wenxinia saemankumensis]SHI82264.1 4-diphosphocytidyl-2-C-methyl-D-erythritol kinase [Wenxinia saemankumensis]
MTLPVQSAPAATLEPGLAPAKLNLGLAVTGQRAGGYHELDSLVAFAGVGDQLSAVPAPELSLSVEGPFSPGVPVDEGNLVLRAAEALRAARGVTSGARIRLVKALPHAAGIGSASSDAAAAIRLLSRLWEVPPLEPEDPAVLELGADVPVCLAAPAAQWMSGIGERLEPAGRLPACGVILVNPKLPLPTADVFAALESRANPRLPALPDAPSWQDLAEWMDGARNDLEAPARALVPEVGRVLDRLRAHPAVIAAVMSGSGPTCIGLTRDAGAARQAARVIQLAEQGWWVVPAPLLS